MKKKILRRTFNRILHLLAMFSPGASTVRPFLHRLRGVKIHGSVFIADQVYLENDYPECVEIHDNTYVGLRSIILAHNRGPGKIVIGEKVWIGPNCVIASSPGRTLSIGDGSVIAASSVITADVPPSTFLAGQRPNHVAKVSVPLGLEGSYEQFIRGLVPIKKNKKG